ncbi:MAG: hypothetical protein V3S21_08655 [Xanthomonadales bacterium]
MRSIKNLSFVYQYEERFDEAIALAEEAKELGSTTPDFAQQGKRMARCDFDLDCVLDELIPEPDPIKDQLRQIYTLPATLEDLEVALQLAASLLRENPVLVNWFNGASCWYDHLTPLFFETWEIAQETGAY